ncbi:Glycoside hydrolase family 3 [Cynara cardunculus var. scolymus]|uniref:Glycoside hydrolase family 3 n=1 Tax=Cynara cardunculus var. scolymus TaxID=59895 RepID=A0A103XPW9_CYNCS|nr:Glycoside hydrolase family 3 [Cynara cardunculus var. scolymus]
MEWEVKGKAYLLELMLMILAINVEDGPLHGKEQVAELLQETVGDKTEVIYHQNPSSETLANQDFSFAIVVVGETPYVESMGDNSELTIPLNGNELITSVTSRLPTLVILISGRPLVLEPEVFGNTDAFVAAWLPGGEGGGITDVIFGDYEFEGKLPMTWFRRVEQLPTSAGEDNYDPLFPIGFGLKSKQMGTEAEHEYTNDYYAVQVAWF